MNFTVLTLPPRASKQPGPKEFFICVRVARPFGAAYTQQERVDARLCTLATARLLEAKMEAAGVQVFERSHGFEFWRAVYGFAVGAWQPAVEVIKAELDAFGFLSCSEIAWADEAELIWRKVHPDSSPFAPPTEEELRAEQEWVKKR